MDRRQQKASILLAKEKDMGMIPEVSPKNERKLQERLRQIAKRHPTGEWEYKVFGSSVVGLEMTHWLSKVDGRELCYQYLVVKELKKYGPMKPGTKIYDGRVLRRYNDGELYLYLVARVGCLPFSIDRNRQDEARRNRSNSCSFGGNNSTKYGGFTE